LVCRKKIGVSFNAVIAIGLLQLSAGRPAVEFQPSYGQFAAIHKGDGKGVRFAGSRYQYDRARVDGS
jgi:hypothetical protein